MSNRHLSRVEAQIDLYLCAASLGDRRLLELYLCAASLEDQHILASTYMLYPLRTSMC